MTLAIAGTTPWYPAPAALSDARFRDVVTGGRLSSRTVVAVSFPARGEGPTGMAARHRTACRRARAWLALTVGGAAVADPQHLHAVGQGAALALQHAVTSGAHVLDWPDPCLLLQAAAVTPPDVVLWTVPVDTRGLAAAAS